MSDIQKSIAAYFNGELTAQEMLRQFDDTELDGATCVITQTINELDFGDARIKRGERLLGFLQDEVNLRQEEAQLRETIT